MEPVAGIEWSIVIGLACGLGLPMLGGLFFIVRAEQRITSLEQASVQDATWRQGVDRKLDSIARDLNQLIGAHQAGSE